MAQKRSGNSKLGVYVIGPDMIFRSRSGHETDLPQPINGEERCFLVAANGNSEPRPYRARHDLEDTIREEMKANGIKWFPEDFEALVEYYEDTWESYTNLASALKASINKIEERGRNLGGAEFLEALS